MNPVYGYTNDVDLEDEPGGPLPSGPSVAAAVPSEVESPSPEPVSVRLKRGWFSPRPTVQGDQSCPRLERVLSALRRVKNIDGIDDIAATAPLVLTGLQRPLVEMSVLVPSSIPVAYAARNAVISARNSYTQEYPDSVRRVLEQQQQVIEALSRDSTQRGDIATQELQVLTDKHQATRQRFEERQRHREKGIFALAKHNFLSKWRHTSGVGTLSKEFIQQTDRVIAKLRDERGESESTESTYQADQCVQREHERKQTKRTRLPRLFTGIGMPGMFTGMVSAQSGCAAELVEFGTSDVAVQAAAASTSAALQTATCGIMIGAQFAQGMSGALNARIHAADHRRIREDLAAVQDISAHLPAHVREVYEQDAKYRLAASARNQALDGMLTAGQTLMLGANVAALTCPPVAAPLVVPGAILTVASSLGNAISDWQCETHLGEDASEPVKQRIRLDNLGPRLREQPLREVVQDVSTQFAGNQEQLVRTQLWNDILEVLKKEASGGKRLSDMERYQRVLDRNHRLLKSGKLLPSGVKRLNELREKHYPPTWFKGSADELQKRLSQEMLKHPASDTILDQPDFQKMVLKATASDLAGRSSARPLFRDGTGQLRRTLAADKSFFKHLEENESDGDVYRRRRNVYLARELRKADRFARADSRSALSDLARVTMKRPEQAAALAEDRAKPQIANFLANASGRSES